ncbi:unnamed protein product, partial [Ectocarpus sp. 12 AP-2014]
CTSAAGGEDAFVFRAAAFTEACPRGAVGVSGVDLRPVTAAATESHRFSCVGAELPMLMRRDGAARIHEGQPRALSNFVRDEGGAAAAVAGLSKSGSKEEEGGGGGGGTDAEQAPRWLWRGPGPPSLWYALEMSGREVGASMEIRLSVNSSAPLTTAAASLSAHGGAGSPSAWHMGPRFSSPSGGDAGGGGSGAPVVQSVPVEDASSMNLSVAMRVGALPVVDPNGEGIYR